MTEKELRWARKSQLREIIDEQARALEALTEEKEWLKGQLAQANAQLEDRSIRLNKAGSIAEASLEINHMFSTAQETANQYLESIKARKEEQEALCAKLEEESKAQAKKLVEDSQERADQLLTDAKRQSEQMIQAARVESQAYWDKLRDQLDAFYKAHQGLREMLNIPNAADYTRQAPVFSDIDDVLGTSYEEEQDFDLDKDFDLPGKPIRLVE